MINRIQSPNVNNIYKQSFGTLRSEVPGSTLVIDESIQLLSALKLVCTDPDNKELMEHAAHVNQRITSIVDAAQNAKVRAEELGTDILLKVSAEAKGLLYSLKIAPLKGESYEVPLGLMTRLEKDTPLQPFFQTKLEECMTLLQRFSHSIFKATRDESSFISANKGTQVS